MIMNLMCVCVRYGFFLSTLSTTECDGKSSMPFNATRNNSGIAMDHSCRIWDCLRCSRFVLNKISFVFLFWHSFVSHQRKSIFFFITSGYRCLRAIGFLSGLAAGAGCIFWIQIQEITLVSSQADSGIQTIYVQHHFSSGKYYIFNPSQR